MISQNFEYSSPSTLSEALKLVAGGAKVLAGGMSLIPMMKLRLAAPEHLVDLSRVAGLNGINEDSGSIRIGAVTTHYQVESSALLRAKCPLLAETAAHIGDVQVRNMGTIGGSIAHADPAADYPAALLALEAKVKLVSQSGERTLAIEDFFVDTLTTALEPGEIVREIVVPVDGAGTGTSYMKMLQPASGFAIVGVAARVRASAGKVTFARIGVTGLAGKAFRATQAEKALAESGDAKKAAALVAAGIEANSDLHASAAYRTQMARVYAERAIRQALSRVA
ncbi:MAG: FAD binding domain-containing protein [Bryobacteraceae bacterium]